MFPPRDPACLYLKLPTRAVCLLALLSLAQGCAVIQPETRSGVETVQGTAKAGVRYPDEDVIQCPELPFSGTCRLSAVPAEGKSLWILGDVLAHDHIYKNGAIEIDASGKIAKIGLTIGNR